MNWYIEVLTKYAVFTGRARRREYWYFFLFSSIISIILRAVDVATGNLYWVEGGIGLFGGIYGLAVLIPSTALTVRRLHDTNRSGWWLFIIALVVPLISLILMSLISGVITDEQPPQPPITGVIVLLMLTLLALLALLNGVSLIVFLIFMLQGGTQGLNRYGGDPKQGYV
jgi:uncharacterized membrane protein YhaH (DUF805 family)